MRIYLSEYEILEEFDRENSYQDYILKFIVFCESNGFGLVRSNVFTDYESINEKIDDSDAVVAFVDKWWSSSSWKLHEVMHTFRRERKPRPKGKVIIFLIQETIPPILLCVEDELEVVSSYEELENHLCSRNLA